MSLWRCVACIFLISANTTVFGQAVPDAGSIRKQFEDRDARQAPPTTEAKKLLSPPDQAKPGGPAVLANHFRFEGNTLISSETLSNLLRSYIGQSLSFDDLQRLSNVIAAEYRKRGRLARVFLGQQDVTEGRITFSIIEARFGRVKLEGIKPNRVNPSMLTAFIGNGQGENTPLDSRALDRALLLADDLPGVSIAGTLTPGSKAGQTDILVRTADEPVLYGLVAFDNEGSRLIGERRLSASIIVNSPLKRGDQLKADAIHAEGTDYIRGSWSIPVAHDGARLSASGSYLDYRVIGGGTALSSATIKGRSTGAALELSYPIIRLLMACELDIHCMGSWTAVA